MWCTYIYAGKMLVHKIKLTLKKKGQVVVAHAFNPSTPEAEAEEAEAGRSLSSRFQPGLQSKFQNSQGYTEKPCLENPNQV